MNTRIEITLGDDNGSAAPLFRQYPQQLQAQPAYLEFDPAAEGPLALVGEYSGEVGTAVPADVFNGRRIRINVPANARRGWLLGLADDAALAGLLERVRSGYEVCDPYSGRAQYSDDATAALEALEEWEYEQMQDSGSITIGVGSASDYYGQNTDEELARWVRDAGSIAAQAAADVGADLGDDAVLLADAGELADVLAERLAEHVRHYIRTRFEGSDEISGLIDLLIAHDADEYASLRADYNDEFAGEEG